MTAEQMLSAKKGYGNSDGFLFESSRTCEELTATASTLVHWRRRVERMAKVEEEVARCGGSIEWCLAAVGQDAQVWAVAQIRRILAHAWIKRFYVGITSRPLWRWTDLEAGHWCKGYHRMYVLAVSDSCSEIVEAEKFCLRVFRQEGRRGECVNRDGHFQCANRAPGGEGGMHKGFAPFFIYVVVEWNRRPPPLDCPVSSSASLRRSDDF
jgi:hypothetical protein